MHFGNILFPSSGELWGYGYTFSSGKSHILLYHFITILVVDDLFIVSYLFLARLFVDRCHSAD